MTTTTHTKFKRLGPGYYYTTKPVTIDGKATHVVIEESDGGSYWMLRLEEFPGMTSIHSTKRHAQFALKEMLRADNMAMVVV